MTLRHTIHFAALLLSSLIACHTNADTRMTILSIQEACTGKKSAEKTKILTDSNVKCRPYVDHGGQQTPAAKDKESLSIQEKEVLMILNKMAESTISKQKDTLSSLLTDNFVIIQPGGNAWDKQTYLNSGFAHLMAMFTEMSFDIELIRITTNRNSATVIANFRLGGLHMGKPATTFGLSTITLAKEGEQWLISHIHNSGMQVY